MSHDQNSTYLGQCSSAYIILAFKYTTSADNRQPSTSFWFWSLLFVHKSWKDPHVSFTKRSFSWHLRAEHLQSCSCTSCRWDRTPAGPAHRVPLLAFAPKICSLCWNGKGGWDCWDRWDRSVHHFLGDLLRYCHRQYRQSWSGGNLYRLMIVGYNGHLQCWLPAMDRKVSMVCSDW